MILLVFNEIELSLKFCNLNFEVSVFINLKLLLDESSRSSDTSAWDFKKKW